MKTSELRGKDIAALEKEVSDLLKAHFGLRMQKATQQLTNHSQLGKTRRDIARAKTIQAEAKRGGRIFIRIFPDKPISQKPAEVRMGNGKGNPEYYVAEIQPGKVLYEINGVPEELAREAFQLASAKLPLRTTFVSRQVGA